MGSLQKFRIKRWFEIDELQNLRYSHKLDENSIVFDVGGFNGETTENYFNKFKCEIWVFEPVEEFAKEIEVRFKGNSKIKVFKFGLSGEDKIDTINIKEDSSSVLRDVGENKVEIKLVKASKFIKEYGISKIDLIDINIEGGEYSLLEDLISNSLVEIFGNIQIQFHDFVDDAENKMHILQDQLFKTHFPTYQFEYVWENWKKRPELEINVESKKHIEELNNSLRWAYEELKVSRKREIDSDQKLELNIPRSSKLHKLKRFFKGN